MSQTTQPTVPAAPTGGGGRPGQGATGKTGGVQRVPQALPKSYLALVLLGLIIVGFIASPDFLTARNATNVITFSPILAVVAVGQVFVILTGGIDHSLGSTLALSTVVTALLLQKG